MLKEAKEMRDIAEDSGELKQCLQDVAEHIMQHSMVGKTFFTFHVRMRGYTNASHSNSLESLSHELAKALRNKGYTVDQDRSYYLKISW